MSVIAPLREELELAEGTILPIDRYLDDTGSRELASLFKGGALYVVTSDGKWLVAVLEAPECAGVKKGDQRAPGWYAAPNEVAVTAIDELRFRSLVAPRKITAEVEAKLRRAIDDEDAPVIAAVAPAKRGQIDADAPPLVKAAALIASGHVVDGIDEMLGAWSRSHAGELGALIDRATRLLRSYDRPLLLTRYADRAADRTWLAAAEDYRATLPQLLQNAGGSPTRIAKLKELPDPRITAWLKTGCPFVGGGRDVARADRAAIDALASAIERGEEPRRTEIALVEAMRDDPDDPSGYQIYADWLLDRQHPRGEYIALAIRREAGSITPAQARRLAALEEVPYLFGAIDEVATSQVRPRVHGVDREIAVYWPASEGALRSLAVQPLARALEQVTLLVSDVRGEPRGVMELVAATNVRMIGMPKAWAATVRNLIATRKSP